MSGMGAAKGQRGEESASSQAPGAGFPEEGFLLVQVKEEARHVMWRHQGLNQGWCRTLVPEQPPRLFPSPAHHPGC